MAQILKKHQRQVLGADTHSVSVNILTDTLWVSAPMANVLYII